MEKSIRSINTMKWILGFLRWICLESIANKETICEKSDYGKSIVQVTGKIVPIIEVFNYRDSH